MLTLLKLSQKIGLIATVAAIFVGLAIAAIVMGIVVDALSQYRTLAMVAICGLFICADIGGLVGFWLVMDHLSFWWLGYRVKWLRGTQWVYEERGAESGVPYVLEIRGRGYPEPCRIWIANAGDWKAESPAWAQHRRDEILERITNCHRAELGGDVQVQEECAK